MLARTSLGVPPVSVPVLSSTMVRMVAIVSRMAPPFTSTPAFAARDSPATIATGTARIRGHGVATTSTLKPRMGSPVSNQAAPAKATVQARKTIA